MDVQAEAHHAMDHGYIQHIHSSFLGKQVLSRSLQSVAISALVSLVVLFSPRRKSLFEIDISKNRTDTVKMAASISFLSVVVFASLLDMSSSFMQTSINYPRVL